MVYSTAVLDPNARLGSREIVASLYGDERLAGSSEVIMKEKIPAGIKFRNVIRSSTKSSMADRWNMGILVQKMSSIPR